MTEHAGKTSLGSPRFFAFLVAQFLGALNDNAFKVSIVMLILATVSGEAMQVRLSSLASAVFPVPFLLFSPIAGYLADRHPKHRVLLATKAPEIFAMALGTLAFHVGSLPFLFVVLFLMATHSAVFSPAKYGIFPEVFDNKDLSLANGILEMTTNLAILIGSVVGVVVYRIFKDDMTYAGLTFLAIACVGTVAVAFAPRAPAGNPRARFAWNVFDSVRGDYAEIKSNPYILYSVLGLAYFGFLGSFFITVIPVFARNSLGLSEEAAGSLLAVLSVGIGFGAVIAGRLSRGHVELGLVPLGSVGITLFAVDLALFGRDFVFRPFGIPERAIADLVLLGVSAGLFSVPLNALLQQRSPEGMKGRVIAFANVMTFSAVLLSSATLWALTSLVGLGTDHAIVVVALTTVMGMLYVLNLLPDFFVRLVLWLLTNTVYRVRVVGVENLPNRGALLVANHVSWVDFMLISAACDRLIRFLMFRPYYEWKGLNWLFRRLHVIPVAAGDPPEKREESLAIAREQIRQGHVACIFAEGGITRTGNLLKFKRGLEQIASGVDCPIVPVFLDGVWGSLFSFERGRFLFKWPKRAFARITVVFGEPLPATTSAFEVRQKMRDLSVEAFAHRKSTQRPLHVEFIRTAKRRWFRRFITDAAGHSVGFGTVLVRAMVLRDLLFAGSRGVPENVGVLLPGGPTAFGANLAVLLAGKTPVNLDASLPADVLRAEVEGAGLRTVVSSAIYLERLGIAPSVSAERLVDIDLVEFDVLERAGLGRRLLFLLLPARLIAKWFVDGDTRDVDRVATVLYSYPREAPDRPRGAVLTHHNLLSNLESVRQVLALGDDDTILGLLPFSNSLGFTATFCLPAVAGIRVAFGARDVYSDQLGDLCAASRVTIVPATPPLLDSLVAHVRPEQLRDLRFVAVGGGELSEQVRDDFTARFGVAPFEGYGCPECAPVVSLNVPDFRREKSVQLGSRLGSTGQPLPGISVRIVDPETRHDLPPDTDGLLLVKGPNVMRGYLSDEEQTRRVLVDGWYVTGDRARLDADGFLTVLPS